ncbi:MAG: patatin [bacterium]|nr:patatin [bacterium]
MTRLGLALGAGGARGLAHIGVLTVLEQADLIPTCISGTSMGAIVGALYAENLNASDVAGKIWTYTSDPKFKSSWAPFIEGDDLDQERNFVQELRRNIQKRILTFKTFTSPAHQKTEVLMEPLEALFQANSIEELKIAFAAVAVDLWSGAPHIFTAGDITQAIYASSAIPAVFPPLHLGDKLLSDGGGPYRVPVKVCRELGADFVLAVDIPSFTLDREEFKSGIDIVMRSDTIARHRLNRMVLREADFVVRPDVENFHWANFAAADRIREAGEAAMRSALPALQECIKERNSIRYRFQSKLRNLIGDT